MELTAERAKRPAHVKEDQVLDFDFLDFDLTDAECQLRMCETIHGAGVFDVFWTPRNGGHWVAARHAAVEEVLKSPELFSSKQFMIVEAMNPDPPLAPLMYDGAEHEQYRAPIVRALTPKVIARLANDARTLAVELIEGFKPNGECEFIGDFATHLPVEIFMSLVDLPRSDKAELLELADLFVRPPSLEAGLRAMEMLKAYTIKILADRRAAPGEDLVSQLLSAEIDGRPIPDEILEGMVKLLLTAGLDTVASSMGFFAHYLAHHPELRQRLVQSPGAISPAVEELLRRFPVGCLGRKATRDVDLFGVHIKAGDVILIPTPGSTLDSSRFEDPTTVDIDRKDKLHLAFGTGPHRCLGAMLARAELRIFLEEWLTRIPDFSLRPGVEVRAVSGHVFGIPMLPLVWDPPGRVS